MCPKTPIDFNQVVLNKSRHACFLNMVCFGYHLRPVAKPTRARRTVFLFIIPILGVIAFTGHSAILDRFKHADHRPGIVWVKIKQEHQDVATRVQANGRLRSEIGLRAIKPIVPSTPKKNVTNARSLPQHVDMSLYFEIRFDHDIPVEHVITELKATGYFEIIEPLSASIKPLISPNDPMVSQQYYLNLIEAYNAWDIAKGDGNVVIAIVDTGGDLDHPDLRDNIYIDKNEPLDGKDNDGDGYIDNNRGWDFSGANESAINDDFIGDNNPSVNNGGVLGHGTKVAGCAGATPSNGIGIAGVGFHTKLLFTKHAADNANPSGNEFSSSPYKGILYAATHGAKIINCSWGNQSNPSLIEQDIIKHVTLDLGCLVIAAAGNSNSNVPFYPASYDYVLSVAASNAADQKHTNSSYGNTVDIVAPGGNILTTSYNDSYGSDSGTSLAAPIVAGAAALVWEINPGFSPLQVAEQLRASADNSFYENNAAYHLQLGKGRLNVFNALTVKLPSIRGVNPKFINTKGKQLAPGDTGALFLDFINFLQPTKSLIVTASSTSPHVTVSNTSIVLGTIQTLDTVSSVSNPFSITLHKGASLLQGIDITLRYFDGVYSDFQVITLKSPAFQNITENNVITSVAANGRIGFGDPFSKANGYGFIYNGHQMASEIGIIMGTSENNLSNNVRRSPTLYDHDFSAVEPPAKRVPGLRSSAEIDGSFNNALTDPTVHIKYKTMVWKNDPTGHYNDFAIIEYTLKNVTPINISNFYFGLFADWDISRNGTSDRALWDEGTRMGYLTAVNGVDLPYAGIQLVKGNVNYRALDNSEINDQYTDAEKFAHISGGLSRTSAGSASSGADVSHVVSSGPHVLTAGEELTIAFALHGANTVAALLNSAKYADSVYNFTLAAMQPVVSPTAACYGRDAVITPQGASIYKWYKDFTGGPPLMTSPAFTIADLKGDTSVFVSNASHSYESVRSEARIIALPTPLARFTFELSDATSEVAFKNNTINAATWLWDFGDGTTTSEKDPVHLFNASGNFTVSLTATSDQGCEDTQVETFLITGLAETTQNIKIFPNPIQNGIVNIGLGSSFGPIKIRILNAEGATVKEIKSTADIKHLDLSAFIPGLYILQFQHEDRVESFKVVKH